MGHPKCVDGFRVPVNLIIWFRVFTDARHYCGTVVEVGVNKYGVKSWADIMKYWQVVNNAKFLEKIKNLAREIIFLQKGDVRTNRFFCKK